MLVFGQWEETRSREDMQIPHRKADQNRNLQERPPLCHTVLYIQQPTHTWLKSKSISNPNSAKETFFTLKWWHLSICMLKWVEFVEWMACMF